jgi:DnaJ-domain-containing protein 1
MSKNDPKGYYARLGIAPSADTAKIKAAYHRLAKEFHPDTNSNAQSKARFQTINEAYQTLGNPERRAAYDALAYTAKVEEPINEKLDPICCSRCRKVTVQPRAVVFRYVVSVIFVTMRNPVQGIFCSACARKAAIKASIISAIAGWWGLPWGPIYTIAEIGKNSAGGDYSIDSEERMLWHNALAFLSQGNWTLSYALANKLRSAANTEIEMAATKLVNYLKGLDISPNSDLKSPWVGRPLERLAHIALACALPLFIVVASSQDALTAWWTGQPVSKPISTSPSVRPKAESVYSGSTFASTSGLHVPKADFRSIDPQTSPTCPWPPSNGQILVGHLPRDGEGHTLEIDNGSGGNAIIKVRDAFSGQVVVSFFIANSGSAGIGGLPDGNYHIQYAFGNKLRQDCRSFITVIEAGQFPDVERLKTEYISSQVIRSRLSYTLYTVRSGNVKPQGISAAAFNSD